jgi:putative DNA primase/helicase
VSLLDNHRAEGSDPGAVYFIKSSLQVAKLGDEILRRWPAALTGEGTLAWYGHGVYRADPEGTALTIKIATLLGNRFRTALVSSVGVWIRAVCEEEGLRIGEGDRSAGLINFRNGMLRYATGELLAHSWEYLSDFQLPVNWNPSATCERYERWAGTQVGEAPVLAALEETVAAMLDPDERPMYAGFLFGPSRSGKGTFLRLAESCVGPQWCSSVSLHQLGEDQHASASLFGMRLNVAGDLSAKGVGDISTWKMLTGGDAVHAHRKYGRQFSFRNRALFLFSANEVPTVNERSEAYLARMRPFSFGTSFLGLEDSSVEMALLGELEGIVARWVRALWRRKCGRAGAWLPVEDSVRLAFAQASNRVHAWIAEECRVLPVEVPEGQQTVVVADHACRTPTELVTAFNAWTAAQGMRTRLGRKHFMEQLRRVPGVVEVRRKTACVRGWNVVQKAEEVDETGGEEVATVTDIGTRRVTE